MEGAINSLASVKESVSSDLEHMKEIYRVFFFFWYTVFPILVIQMC